MPTPDAIKKHSYC